MIRAADWIIDLGPEGGERGGSIVCAGTANEVRAHPQSHTGRALAEYERALGGEPAQPASASGRAVKEPAATYATAARANGNASNSVVIHNAREHNLKSIDVQIPRDRLTVITGVSGSGKSTLAFDILFNEGQRRYLESLNAYARQFVQPAARPDVDAIFGIPPTVAIEQRTSRGGRKSTVATLTEIYHFLRLLYVKLGYPALPRLRCRDRAAERRLDRRAAAARAPRHAHRAAGAARRGAQGLLHGPRQVGREEGLQDPARRRRLPFHGAVAAAVALQGTYDRAARRGDRCRRENRHRAASGARPRARLRQGPGARAESEERPADGLLDQAGLPLVRAQLRRARPAPLLLQLQARLVRELLRHWPGRCPAFEEERSRPRRPGGTTAYEASRRPAPHARASG